MQLDFLQLSPDERKLYFEQAAARRGLSTVILEIDFWVCWMLGVLFDSRLGGHLVFKGGTSLSKVFGAINRFSEDIDLSLSPEFLGLPKAGESRNQADKWMKKAEAACTEAVRDAFTPELEKATKAVLGKKKGKWLEYLTDPLTNSPVLLFHYPTTQPAGLEYLKRSVKLEFGSLTDQQPAGRHEVRPWIAEILATEFEDWHCEVVALEVERTFWEKATILHAEHHRPQEKQTPDRFSRHYADTAALANGVANKAIADAALRERVVHWKSQFFGSQWARYDLAQPGTFRLVPPDHRVAGLKQDYEKMKDMYLSAPLPFDRIMAVLADMETQINRESR